MSGICGLFNLDKAPVVEDTIRTMCAMLERRGPDGTHSWQDGSFALGHTLLLATPEAAFESQPFLHAESGCVVTADARLDNRDELLAKLLPGNNGHSVGDAELIVLAYLAWGEQCPGKLRGDFAFAIRDPREQRLFCARDHFGMRPFYYHHAPAKRFCFGSSPDALLVLADIPYRLNEARIADYLIQDLEWVDYTSTFFEGVFRLPPGHSITVTEDRLRTAAYWQPEPGPNPGPLSDDDWRDGLLEVLTLSVDARLRAPAGQVGSMLSGGMDSGSVVAVAKDILHGRSAGDLPTYSAVCGSRELAKKTDCAESQAIYATTELPHIRPTVIHPESSIDDLPLMLNGYEEPFDTGFMFLKKIFAVAADQGMRVILDGAGGDVVLSSGSYLTRLLRAGHFRKALAEMAAENRCYGGGQLPSIMAQSLRAAFVPELLKQPGRRVLNARNAKKSIQVSLVSKTLAQRVDLMGRYERMRDVFAIDRTGDYAMETVARVLPCMTAGKERYARLAAACGVEARDPFMDMRLIQFCAHLPGHLRVKDYQQKYILRQIMDGRVPDEVAWSHRKPHIGWLFNRAVERQRETDGALGPVKLQRALGSWLDQDALARSWAEYEQYGYSEEINTAMCLAAWLEDYQNRPVVQK